MFLSLGLYAGAPIHQGAGHAPNDGKTPPGTFTSKSGTAASSPITSESGITNSSGVTTDQMNTSPNAAPATDEEARRDSTLSSGTFDPRKPDEIEAQEENALDYSTTPKKRTTTPLGPNKK